MTESGNLLDNAEVEFLLDGALPDEDGQGENAAAPEQTATMHGNLDQIDLSDIFQTLAMTKMEGLLRVHNPLENRQVFCKDGYVRVLVPPRIVHRRLGARLVNSGMITADQLRSALMRQRKEKLPLGEMLVAEGVIDQERIEDVASMQIAEDLFALFTWKHGTFEFYKGPIADDGLRQRFESCTEFEVSSLLLEVARRSDEWESILAAIKGLDEVPQCIVDESTRELNDLEYEVFRAADGLSTYRDIASRASQSLFDTARAARDLVNEGMLGSISDEEMAAAGAALAGNGQHKQAVMLLQTLRDRPGDRELETVRSIAGVLECCGERRLAGLTLLEVAQLQTDADLALTLARDACGYAPRDAETLSFLRTTLLAHSSPDSDELATCTVALIDSLIESSRLETALEIIANARSTGSATPQVLMREARTRQKSKDFAGAVAVLEELVGIHREAGDNARLTEVYEAILRLDRSRIDARKFLDRARRSKASGIIRLAAAIACAAMLGSMGLVWWNQSRHEESVRLAAEDIAGLLRSGDRIAARQRLQHWSEVIGEGEPVDDMRRQVDFADAAELQRRARLARRRMTARLTEAAEDLAAGDLAAALQVYAEVRQDNSLRREVDEVIATRLEAVLNVIGDTAKVMATQLPPPPNELLDRKQMVANLTALQELCTPTQRRLVGALAALNEANEWPDYVTEAMQLRIRKVLADTAEAYAGSNRLAEAYTEALQRNDSQRRFDPLFKEAMRREQTHDFAGALELFGKLEKVEAADPELRTVFRDHVTRNATICKLIDALGTATEGGDHAVAHQQLRALELAFPDVPFQSLIRLPVRIETRPAAAIVSCNGSRIGPAPRAIAYVPAEPNRLEVALEGFRTIVSDIPADHDGTIRLVMHFLPESSFEHGNAVDVPPTVAAAATILVDRGGQVSAIEVESAKELWSYRSGDLSGLLSQAFLFGELAVFASLDGDLRALRVGNGDLAWSLPDLPTEVTPAHAGRQLAIATTDDRICLVDLADRTVQSKTFPGSSAASLATDGELLYVATRRALAAHDLTGLEQRWRIELPDCGERHLATTGDALVLTDDRGHVSCHATADGSFRWRHVEPSLLIAAAVLDEDAVLFASPKRVVRLALRDGQVLREVPMAVTCKAPPRRIGNRLLVPTKAGQVDVLDIATGNLLYGIAASERGTITLPWRDGVMIALPDRGLHFYPVLR